MANFNNISVNSSLNVIPVSFASLGFSDNLLVSKSKYNITNNVLSILTPSRDTFTVFNNNSVANTYEFEYIRLNTPGVILPKIDINQKQLDGLAQDKVLVFINGKLQPTSAYTIVNKSTLQFNYNYTNDYNKLYDVIIYVSNAAIQRITYSDTQIAALEAANPNLVQNTITLPIAYDYKNTLLFINEAKVPFNAIEIVSGNNEVKLNIPERLLNDVNLLEIIKLDNSTTSINFTTQHGYSEYGPYDDLGKKLPNTHDVILRFTDQAKLLIDNIRPGFVIKEVDGYGEAVIVDTSFESMEVKALLVQPFPKSSYLSSEYYALVPEAKSIVEYLAQFDRKYTFLPEILSIFQRLLLDDINDTIQRMREARSISRVDSVHINKLIKLLGFNINIKQLNKKQRRELLEELNEFYRIAGTRNSYNLINVLQNNLKLISADQLFTPSGFSKRNNTLYNYEVSVAEGGTGYEQGDALALETSGLIATVDEVDENGAITAVSLETSEGYKNINTTFDVNSILHGIFKVNSIPNKYKYNWSVTDSTNKCIPNMHLYNSTRSYGIRVDTVNADGTINTFTPLSTRHATDEDILNVNFNNLQLYQLLDNLTVTIVSEPLYNDNNDYGTPILSFTKGGEEFEEILEAGTYFVESAGGGGAGAAADSKSGNEYDLPATNGYNGELKTLIFTLNKATSISGKVGQGGGAVKARGHDPMPYNSVAGKGFNNGSLGELLNLAVYTKLFKKHRARYGNIAGGQGGGSSGLKFTGGDLILEARGGNGGSANGLYGESVAGGIGGAGGTTAGNGGAGGSRAKGGTFWSEAGKDGWIKIYRVPSKYNITINGNTSICGDGQVFQTVECGLLDNEKKPIEFNIISHVNSSTGEVTFEHSPTEGVAGVFGTFNLTTTLTNQKANLTLVSTVSLWDYTVKLMADVSHISAGSTFVNLNSPLEEQFEFVASKDNSTEGTWTPTKGTKQIILNNVPAYTREGAGGRLLITSSISEQKNEDRCYIDFYKKEEIGAEPITEFRSYTIEYGRITEGTPNSPKWWEVGSPDVEYGTIDTDSTDFIEYGKIGESTEGEWVEWWKWDREKNWYPTNHVDLEMKLPPGVNFSEYVNTFIEQFYNLASTVVFIHQITESFYFGNDTTTNYNSTVTSPDGLVGDSGAMIAPFGIVSTMPLVEQKAIITSDPARQYINPIADDFSVTIIPKVDNATVEVITENTTSTGAIVQDVKILTEADNWTTKIKYGTEIVYKVSAPGYITRARSITVKTNIVKYVVLEATTPNTLKYCKFKLNTVPLNANVTFTVNNTTTTNSHTIYAWEGNTIQYCVSYPNRVTQKGSIVITNDTEQDIVLESGVDLTIITNPANAKVKVIIDNQEYTPRTTFNVSDETGEIINVLNIITVPINRAFDYTVSACGYTPKSETITISEATTKKVALMPIN